MNAKTDLSKVNVALSAEEKAAIEEAEAEGDSSLGTVEGDDSDVTDIPVAGVPGAKPDGDDASGKAAADGGKPADAAVGADAGKPADVKAADAAVVAVVEEVVPPLRLPEITASQKIPEDLDAQLDQADKDQKALDKRYDDGEVEAREYNQESRKISDRRADLVGFKHESDLVTRTNEAARVAHWKTAQDTFFDTRPEFRGSAIMSGALDAALRTLYADPKYAGADYGWLLRKAGGEVDKAIGKPAAAAAPATPAAATPAAAAAAPVTVAAQRAQTRIDQAANDRKIVPKTLGGLPAAAADSPGGGEFSHLDNLTGMELESAIARLPAEQAERYLSS